MNATPQETTSSPGRRPINPLIWMAGLAGATFVILCILFLVSNPKMELADLILTAVLASIVVAVTVVMLVIIGKWLLDRRNLQRSVFALACAITLVGLFYAVENWRGRHAWKEHREKYEPLGEKFSVAAIAPPAVPDEKNFAMTPLLAPVMAFSNSPTGIVWLDTNGIARLEKISPELSSGRQTNDHLVLGTLEKGTFADLAVCADFYRGNTNYPQAPASAKPAEVILTALSKFDPALEELRQAAATRPEARFPIQYQQEPAFAILLPHLVHVKRLALLTHVHAVAELEAGRSTNAFADLELGLRLSGSVREEPILIDHLVRLASLTFQLQTIREGLVRHAWSDAQLAEIESRLASLNLLSEFQAALRGERVLDTTSLDYMRQIGLKGNPLDFIGENNDETMPAWVFILMPSGWYYQNMLTISRIFQEYIFPTVDERTRRVFPELADKQAKAIEALRSGPQTIFAKKLLPALTKAVQRTALAQTWVDATRVACAIERYRLANGKLPDRLEGLQPGFIVQLPLDVIGGKPLRYVPEADGSYNLYSIGWNQVDDHGEVVTRNGTSPVSKVDRETRPPILEREKGDWVWRMPAGLAPG